MSFAIIPQQLSITAMRSSGYKDSAYALAELIDNSIQAGEGLNRTINVEVICIDKAAHNSPGRRRRLNRVAVVDNASGMDRETLRKALQFGVGTHLSAENQKGIGKFGMGLPNSSISQCRHVEVYTWRDGQTWRSYLDVGEIEAGDMVDVPEPQPAVLPQEWLKLISSPVGDSGTLVIWTELDLMQWKQSTALLRNAEFMIGRIYRHFISKGKASIRLAPYEETGPGRFTAHSDEERFVRANDPLMLMSGTSAPAPYDKVPAFDLFGEEEIDVGFCGETHKVLIRASISKVETRKAGGRAAIGDYAKKNQGVSVVRADRELELNHSFENSYDSRERWWGIEVSFPPGLDPVFGVTNNKQAATQFRKMSVEEDAKAQEMSLADFQEQLQLDNDPRLPMYEINKRIASLYKNMRAQIDRINEGERVDKGNQGSTNGAEAIATRALRRRQEKIGKTGESDQQEAESEDKRTETLISEIEQEGLAPERAREIAVSYVQRKIKFLFRHADYPGYSVFDVTSKAGVIIITINTKHPAQAHLFELLREGEADVPDSPALQGLKLLLTAWARMEDEASGDSKEALEDIRGEWGRIARDFMKEVDE